MSEDGVIPDRYPLMPLPNGGYRQRTRLNVVDSDGTAILSVEALSGGTRLTRNLCALLKRPYVLIDARRIVEPAAAAEKILQFVDENQIRTLNVAGPGRVVGRKGANSRWPSSAELSEAMTPG
jgi:hypothetical protein